MVLKQNTPATVAASLVPTKFSRLYLRFFLVCTSLIVTSTTTTPITTTTNFQQTATSNTTTAAAAATATATATTTTDHGVVEGEGGQV